jgi:hypothetical protein
MRDPAWWAIFPSGDPDIGQACADAWREVGWSVAVFTDYGERKVDCDMAVEGEYQGQPATFNRLIRYLLRQGQFAGAMCGNDDMFPGPGADVRHFSARFIERFPDTFGVAQATGDWYDAMDWCAPAPLIGRDYCWRINQGFGPWWSEYHHLHCDQELRSVAMMLDAYAEFPDVTIEHRHHSRGHADQLPPLKRLRLSDRSRLDAGIYQHRAANGFPGHEPVQAAT